MRTLCFAYGVWGARGLALLLAIASAGCSRTGSNQPTAKEQAAQEISNGAARPNSSPAPCGTVSAKQPQHPEVFTNSLNMRFRLIPAGKFLMGPANDEPGKLVSETQFEVTLTRSFYIAECETTQYVFLHVMGNNPSWKKVEGDLSLPVENVSWYEAEEFCRRLSEKENRTYRLPTEAEWEYACRAGTAGAFSFPEWERCFDPLFASVSETCPCPAVDYVWYVKNNDPIGPKPVATLKPNPWGLFDMHGNVMEWCYDWAEVILEKRETVDPVGLPHALFKATRGGTFRSDLQSCRSASRGAMFIPEGRSFLVGFRVLLEPE